MRKIQDQGILLHPHTPNTETTQRFTWFGYKTYIYGGEKQIHYMMVNTKEELRAITKQISLTQLTQTLYDLRIPKLSVELTNL